MMSHRILSAALVLCALTAACGEIPTGTDAQAQPAGPAYDGGFTMGSGNSAVQSGGYGMDSGKTATEFDGSVESADGGSGEGSGDIAVEGGGFTMGSGNIVAAGGPGAGSGSHDGGAPGSESVDDTASGDSTGRGGFTMGSGN